MPGINKKIQYFLYARKSSESEDRQVQSIDDQINRLKLLAQSLSLDIKQIYTESKSAKKPNNRPLFDEMMKRIEKGEAGGILCWQINRLSRLGMRLGKTIYLQHRISPLLPFRYVSSSHRTMGDCSVSLRISISL